ncbi:MAG: thioredoxin domain-containing protein [Spirochaetes bacterium]|nr:thioredoxin domain-containing protein [Spirochaetota bacterium]
MKKIVYPLLALAVLGAVLSGLLLIQHYYPDMRLGAISCGEGIVNPCLSLSQSGYSTLFTIPVAAYGLLWYLLALFILLIADYAEGRYHDYALAMIMPLSVAAVLADIALGVILIITQLLCKFCIATYAVNIAMLALVVVWYRTAARDTQFSLPGVYRDLILPKEPSPDRKAFYLAFVLFIFLLGFAVFSTSYILKMKTEKAKLPDDRAAAFISNFYKSPVEKLDLPDTGIVLGNPKADLTIVAFTDFLCSACYEFYRIETFLLAKYRDRIKTVYYNYPLDMGCNREMKRTVYVNSCVASRAFIAASDAGILDQYILKHFADYQNTHTRYAPALAITAFNQISQNERKGMDETRFLAAMNSEGTTRRLEEHMKLAKQLRVDATPTLFIGGRRLVGVPPAEILDQIIKTELDKK